MKAIEAQQKLNGIYAQWGAELKALDTQDFDLTCIRYSKPHYMSIPETWFDDGLTRILIVGEEARADWNVDGWRDLELDVPADIEKIVAWYGGYYTKQLSSDRDNFGAFWTRFCRIAQIPNSVCAWTNLDKIHHNGQENCPLTRCERKKLHTTATRILQEEVQLLQPHIVVFCGFSDRDTAIKAELSTVAKKFYGKPGEGYISFLDDKLYRVSDGGIEYVFARHPNRASKNYEAKVLAAVRNIAEGIEYNTENRNNAGGV